MLPFPVNRCERFLYLVCVCVSVFVVPVCNGIAHHSKNLEQTRPGNILKYLATTDGYFLRREKRLSFS